MPDNLTAVIEKEALSSESISQFQITDAVKKSCFEYYQRLIKNKVASNIEPFTSVDLIRSKLVISKAPDIVINLPNEVIMIECFSSPKAEMNFIGDLSSYLYAYLPSEEETMPSFSRHGTKVHSWTQFFIPSIWKVSENRTYSFPEVGIIKESKTLSPEVTDFIMDNELEETMRDTKERIIEVFGNNYKISLSDDCEENVTMLRIDVYSNLTQDKLIDAEYKLFESLSSKVSPLKLNLIAIVTHRT